MSNESADQTVLDTLPAVEPTPAALVDPDIAMLAKLSKLEYDRIRDDTAEQCGLRVSTLDKLVSDHQRETPTGGKSMFKTVEPYRYPVAAITLLDEIRKTLLRFIICTSETATAATLWIVFTWLIDRMQVAPIAMITAPEKRCGKSQLLDFIGRLSKKALVASNISPAAVFRVIEAHNPTLLIDEADTFLRENEELRGVINSGHTRQSAYVIRTVGDDHEPKQFGTFGPKCVCGIGKQAETLMDRSIVLELRRKMPTETVQRLRHAEPGLFDRLASKLARFAEDFGEKIEAQRPDLPEKLNDRAQDNWEPLLQIADFAGGHWPSSARNAALKISGEKEDAQSVSTELLADIQSVFEEKRTQRIYTADLIVALVADDEKSWATYNRGQPLSPKQLARRLQEFGIKSKDMRSGIEVKKGFELSQFADAFARYLSQPPENLPLPATFSPKPNNHGGLRVADAGLCSATSAFSSVAATNSSSGQAPDVAANGECSATENVPATEKARGYKVVACSGKNPGDGGKQSKPNDALVEVEL